MNSKRTYELPMRFDRIVGLLSKVYAQDGERSLQELLVNAKIRIVEETGYDNWDGGQYGHDVYLAVGEKFLIPFLKNKSEIEGKIRTDLNSINDVPKEYVENVVLQLEDDPESDWRQDSGLLSAKVKSVPAGAEQRIWRESSFRVFLSHKSEVKEKVGELKDCLSKYGISSFVAHEDVHPTQDWQNEIEAALETADAFIAVLTDKFHESLWTDQEVGYAFARGIPIIALRLGRDPYGFIGRFQALSCTWNSACSEIVKLLMTHDRMVGAFIDAIRRARSFDEANTLSDMLPYIERLSDESAGLLIDAYNENTEVRGGFGFNGWRPKVYGEGLLFHLDRMGVTGFAYDEKRKIVKELASS